MESTILIYIIIAAFVIWVLFIRKITPENKTDEQLQWLYERASSNFMRTLESSKEFELIINEMEKRGLLNKKDQAPNTLSKDSQMRLDEATKLFEESGTQEQLKKLFSSGAPERLIHKVLEIAVVKNITQEEASTYLNELFDTFYHKHKNAGLSDNEADQLALNEVLAMKINKT